jgi:hypothetical protein
MALQLSLKGFLADLSFNALFGLHFLEAFIFILKLFKPLHHACVHAIKLGAPFIKLSRAHAVFTAKIWNGYTVLVLLQYRQDLTVCVS